MEKFAENVKEFTENYAILNALHDQIAIIDLDGVIQFTNLAWNRSLKQNVGHANECGKGSNYLKAAANDAVIQLGIQQVLTGQMVHFKHEYACHTLFEKKWYIMRVSPLQTDANIVRGAIITHIDITDRKQLELKLSRMAITDPLTSLYNRRYFEEELKQEMARSARYGHALSLILLDIDYFKGINDTHGHEVGDQVLRELSQLLQSSVRDTDVCARLGGDEFVILLPETCASDLKVTANRILKQVRTFVFNQSGNNRLELTISMGAVCETEFPVDLNMIAKADQALYGSKEKGRNRLQIVF